MVVIGSGPGGQRAAMQGAKAGKRVAIVEMCGLGGGCLHNGTLPSKSLRESVYRWSLGSRGSLGQESEHSRPVTGRKLPEMARLLKRKERVVESEIAVVRDQLERNRITIARGRARLLSANEVEVVNGRSRSKLRADFIFIAVGARPVAPAHFQLDGKRVFDSTTILDIKKLPRALIVLGAGIIGTEYASMFSMAGTHVTLVDKRHEILASVDREVVDHLVERFESQGMDVVLEAEAMKLERTREGIRAHLSNGKKLNADAVLVAQGRYGNTEGLGLEAVGVPRDDRGQIKVDAHYRTAVPNIYAVGDVVGSPALASTSMEQGRIAACHALGLCDDDTVMSPFFPYGIYTIPEISMCGPTEEELAAKKADFVTGRARYRELARGQIVGDRWGLLKLLVDRTTLKLLGVHIVGDNAAELVHIGQAVLAYGGDVHYFIRTVFNYPTLAEAYKTAAFHAVNQLKGVTTTK